MKHQRTHTRLSSRWFATTRWSIVLAAGDRADQRSVEALRSLCETYWYPLYGYARHRGLSRQDAEDLVQAFFTRLLEKDRLRDVGREGGTFRSFLLVSLKHFLVDDWKRKKAQKRGGDKTLLSLDVNTEEAESRYQYEPVDTTTPERLFERNWAVTLLDTVFTQLQHEQRDRGRAEQFEHLKFCLSGQRSDIPYAELAANLHVSEASLKVTVHRLRQRYRELLRQEVAHTVSTPEEVEEELRYLFEVLSR
jgi:RNA polymerase sigma-70 factor (ECF subfamily)